MGLGVVALAFNPSSWEAETGGSLLVPGQPHLYSETLSEKAVIDSVFALLLFTLKHLVSAGEAAQWAKSLPQTINT